MRILGEKKNVGKFLRWSIYLLVSFVLVHFLYFYFGNIATSGSYTNLQVPKSIGHVRVHGNFYIKFDFYINDQSINDPNSVVYENIFQTADYNNGIRLELSRSQQENKWAIVFTDKNDQLVAQDLGQFPEISKWHNFAIEYNKKLDAFKIILDNQVIFYKNDVNAKFSFERVIIGNGFVDRIFNGSVKNFKIIRPYNLLIFKWHVLVTILLLIAILSILFRKKLYQFTTFMYSKTYKHMNLERLFYISALLLLIVMVLIIFTKKFGKFIDGANYLGDGNYSVFRLSNELANDSFEIGYKFYIKPNVEKIEDVKYENIFQTADYNTGLRVEFARKTDSVTLWGMNYSNTDNELKSINLAIAPSENTWHDMVIRYIRSKNRIDVFVNGINLRSVKDVNLNAKFDNVIVGKGFEDRAFNGEIKNFYIMKSYIDSNFIAILLLLVVFVYIFSFIVSLKKDGCNHRLLTILTTVLLSILSILFYRMETNLVGNNNLIRFSYLYALLSIFFSIFLLLYSTKFFKLIKITTIFIVYVIYFALSILYFVAGFYGLEKFASQDRRAYGLSLDEIAAIYQSSFTEGWQFLTTNIGLGYIFALIFIVLTGIILIHFLSKTNSKHIRSVKPIILYTMVVTAFFYALPKVPTFPKVLKAGFVRYSQFVKEIEAYTELRNNLQFQVNYNDNIPRTHVLVIGESMNKKHMSSYGYFRDTTPWLKTMREEKNSIFLENVYSPYCHTVPSLMKVLTQANQYNLQEQKRSVSILDVAKKAGFKIYLISEQPDALQGTPFSAIMKQANIRKYIDEKQVIKVLSSTMNEVDKTENNLIIIHLMGSHADYNERIKQSNCDSVFEDKEKMIFGKLVENQEQMDLLNQYDSTVKCTDTKLQEIFKNTIQQYDFIDSFIYFSDHGEDVLQQKFHNSGDFTFDMVSIPLFVYLSERYNNKYPSVIQILTERKDYVFTADLLFNTLLDLYHIGFSGVSSPDEYSLLSKNYIIDDNNALVMQKALDEDDTFYVLTPKKYIKDDPYYIAKRNIDFINKNFKKRILSVNNDILSVASENAKAGFNGLEFNIDLPSMKIGHSPQYVFNLPLIDFLRLDFIRKQDFYWFDLKTKNDDNISKYIDNFEEINRSIPIKDKVLIESWNDGLDRFTQNGWFTSYYIHENNILKDCGERKDSNCAATIAKRVRDVNAKSISFAASSYPFIVKYVEPLLPSDITYNVFGFTYDFSLANAKFRDNVQKSEIFNNPRVKIILLDGVVRFTLL